MTEPIPFNRPSLEGDELEHIRRAVEHGHTSAHGPYSELVSEMIAEATGARQVLLTTSGTAALEMSALLLDVGPGDTVVVPSFGFVTTALAYTRQGAKVLFCDIEPETLGLDPERVAEVMDESVRAVVPIHYAGVPCRLDALLSVLTDWPRAELVEDNAHGLFASYRGRPLGSFGRFGALSFHETKNFTCGEGGALLVNHEEDVERANVVFHKGTDRTAFLLGQVDKYTWQDTGSSFGLSDVLAAYLYGQLEQRASILARRKALFHSYLEGLAPQAEELGYRLPVVPADCTQAYHMFYVLLPDREARDAVITGMAREGFRAAFHYVPLHRSPYGRKVSAARTACPVADDVSGRLLRLPFYNSLSSEDAHRVVGSFLSVLRAHRIAGARSRA